MNTLSHAKAEAKRNEFNFALWATIGFFGLMPLALGISLGVAQYFQLFR
jgi:hypothetical protein